VRENAKKTLNWLLVPVAAGSIANVAAMGLSMVIGPEAGAALVVAAVVGSALAKYLTEDPDGRKQDSPG
jgi:hypothetical protein